MRASIEEYRAVEEAAAKFVRSVAEGDSRYARELFIDEAVVRVLEEQWGGRIDFTDYLLMMKMDGRWRCVAKAYNQNSNTIQK